MLFVYINGFPMVLRGSLKNFLQQMVLCADIMVFWTALPYFLFGDIFKLSEKINPENPQNGVYVLRILGVLSIVTGFVTLFLGVKFIN